MNRLSGFQAEVARLFFSLPASEGFLLAGGGAFLATGLTDRPTHDLDFFGAPNRVDISAACAQFESAVEARGWRCDRIQSSDTFVRLRLSGDAEVVVDLALDSPAQRPPFITVVGPAFDLEELAGRKLLALFGRAEARDFADVFVLARRFGRSLLLERASEVDRGFDHRVLAEMMRTINRFADDDLPIDIQEVESVREFFRHWADELDGGTAA